MLACVCQPTDPALFRRSPVPLGAPPLKLNNNKGCTAGAAPRPGRIYRIPVVITSEPKTKRKTKSAGSSSSCSSSTSSSVGRDVDGDGGTGAQQRRTSSGNTAKDSSAIGSPAKVKSMCVEKTKGVQKCDDSEGGVRGTADSVLVPRKDNLEKLPDGVQLTLSELRDMACRQQAQIESQHQLLAAKEQRLRYLKEQEARQQRVQAESERLRRLRDRVDAQELKLRKLRAIRGQVDHQKQNNISLTSDLDSIRALFNEKEKELSLAVAKVDELTKQLEELRRGRSNRDQPPASALELDKLRRELMYRNKLNEQQNHRLNQQREALTARQEEMSAIDKRISELQERLHRKRLLNQQLANQISATSHKAAYHQFVRLTGSTDQNNQGYPRKPPQNSGTHPANGLSRSNIAAVEPYNHVPLATGQPVVRHGPLQEINKSTTTYHPVYQQTHHIKSESEPKPETQDLAKLTGSYPNRTDDNGDMLKDFSVSKSDPKYQTLPYNTKFTVNLLPSKGRIEAPQDVHQQQEAKESELNGATTTSSTVVQSQMVHSAPLNVANKNIATPLSQNDLLHKGKDKENDVKGYSNGAKMSDAGFNMSSTNSTLYQKPVSSVAPTSVHHSAKLSNIYQTSSIKVQPVEPQTLLTTKPPMTSPPHVPPSPPQASPSLSESSSDKSKPALPPKPAIKPPPRQTQLPNDEPQIPPPLPLTDPPEDKGLKSVEVMHPLSLALSKLQGGGAGAQKGSNSPSPATNSPVMQHSPVTNSPVLQHSPQLPTSPQDNMPIIKAKPLTIKKQLLSEQPKLRTLSSYSRLNGIAMSNRRIELPPAFHFPEAEKSEVNGNEVSKGTDEADKVPAEAVTEVVRRCKKGNLKQNGKANLSRRVSFDPLALLLDASLEGELELVRKTATQVANPSAANDEGITALHNAICAGHLEIVKFLVEFGCDVNAQDSDGWTPLHCAASCNNVAMVRFLVEHGACIFATTLSDHETAAEKCEEDEEGFDGCSEYLYSVQEKLGILSGGAVFAVFDYAAQQPDELSFKAGQQLTILRKGDESEREWWWSRLGDKEGYVPRNLLGLYPRVSRSDE